MFMRVFCFSRDVKGDYIMAVLESEKLRERCLYCNGRAMSICNVIDLADLPALVGESEELHFSAGERFIHEGMPAVDFYVIASGMVKIFNILADGRRQIISFARSGDFLGLAAEETYEFAVEAVQDVKLCRFSHHSIGRLIEKFPQLEKRLRDEARRELMRLQRRLLALGRQTAREKVASFLLDHVHLSCGGCKDRKEPVAVFLPMTRYDIADYLGLTIETVSRMMRNFEREKLIEITTINYIKLINEDRLNAIEKGAH